MPVGLLRNMRFYSQGLLAESENTYYEALRKLCCTYGFLSDDGPPARQIAV